MTDTIKDWSEIRARAEERAMFYEEQDDWRNAERNWAMARHATCQLIRLAVTGRQA